MVESEFAARRAGIVDRIKTHDPAIIHFAVHSSRDGQILLENGGGAGAPAAIKDLASDPRLHGMRCECVVLNGCYTVAHARPMLKVSRAVITWAGTLDAETSITFSRAFYRSLLDGSSVLDAFAAAEAEVRVNQSTCHPVLICHCDSPTKSHGCSWPVLVAFVLGLVGGGICVMLLAGQYYPHPCLDQSPCPSSPPCPSSTPITCPPPGPASPCPLLNCPPLPTPCPATPMPCPSPRPPPTPCPSAYGRIEKDLAQRAAELGALCLEYKGTDARTAHVAELSKQAMTLWTGVEPLVRTDLTATASFYRALPSGEDVEACESAVRAECRAGTGPLAALVKQAIAEVSSRREASCGK